MAASEDRFGPGESRAFSPYLAPEERVQLKGIINFVGKPIPGFAAELRALARRYVDDGDSIKLRAVCLLVADLFEQGWQVTTGRSGIIFSPPGLARSGAETVEDIKHRVRQALQLARLRQLAEPSAHMLLPL